ncbi:hypothetical protein ACSBR2_023368 [Camellia fascicularis]
MNGRAKLREQMDMFIIRSRKGMMSQCDEKMSDFVFCKVRNFLERCKIWSKNSRT